MLPNPVIEDVEGFKVVRDDLLEGGSKRRAFHEVLPRKNAKEFIYVATPYGHGQLALALSCRALGLQATVIYPKLDGDFPPVMEKTRTAGAQMIVTDHIVPFEKAIEYARGYAAGRNDAVLLEPGLDGAEFIAAISGIAKRMDVAPQEVWCAAGSGALTRALQLAWPQAVHHAVCVRKNDGQFGVHSHVGDARVHFAAEAFNQAAQNPPPFPSSPYFEAKIWRLVKQQAIPGALVWNM